METFNEMVDRLFADSEDEIEAFRVWIYYDADDATVRAALRAVEGKWICSERHDKARAILARSIEEEGR